MCGNLLLAAGTDSVALPHDKEGPCAGHRGILFAFLFSFVLLICFSFLGIWGFFLFFRLFFNYLSQESSIIVASADSVMSSEAQGGLPQA
jgi:hypothetical protein